MSKKIVEVAGGKGKYAYKYRLLPSYVFKGQHYFAARAEWRALLGSMFFGTRCDAHEFRYYTSTACITKTAVRSDDGGVDIGCQHFTPVSLRKIAAWCGWFSSQIRANIINKKGAN